MPDNILSLTLHNVQERCLASGFTATIDGDSGLIIFENESETVNVIARWDKDK